MGAIMEKFQLFSLLLFGLFLLFYTGSTIRCYKCNSFFQADCADWFDNKTFNLEQCADDQKLCRKIVQEVYYLDKWEVRYIRQCAKSGEVGGDEGRQCVDRYGSYNVKMRYCHCDNQEGCNTGSSRSVSYYLLALPLLAVLGHLYSKLLNLT
ncbi:hypothetical protein KUTeg_004232 [Tegillarca granosa]|uniref:Protein sleepless n=1 Tax=Tegillarca granosa TaxID=220873 RepID=A0ABQ9FQY7_TEGGR|nr:hypothetical protein KUTeg_004232 [Tegillarca granosa]